jgi:flagellar motility protein MotE (MotC chaperone)
MASKRKTKAKAPAPHGSDKQGESIGLMHGLLTVLLSLLIVLVVFGGAFYYVLKNNVYGLGERFRPGLERIPVIKLALPPLPETEDPDDPRHLTRKELLDRYNAYRKDYAELTSALEDAKKRIDELTEEINRLNALKTENEAERQRLGELRKQIEEEAARIEEDRIELSRIAAQNDPKGFIEFFEKTDSKTAEKLYQELVTDEVVDQKIKSQARTFEEMEPQNAADILTRMSDVDRELLINIIRVMKPDVAAEIVELMEPGFAAELMQDVVDKILGRQ